MLIVCPACASEYEIPTDRVGPAGRQVRCASCRETWFITPDAESAIAVEPAEISEPAGASLPVAFDETPPALADGPVVDQPTPYREPPSAETPAKGPARAKRKPSKGAKKANSAKTGLRPLSPALAAGLVVFVILPLALLGRSTVVRAMPQSAALFSRIGLPVNLRGVDLRDVVAFQNQPEGDKPGELIVEGDLVGAGRARTDVPDLAVEVRDEHGQTLYRWTVPAPRAALENAETARFRASLSAPPAKGRAVEVRFADPKMPEHAAPAMRAKEPDAAVKTAGDHHGGDRAVDHGQGAAAH